MAASDATIRSAINVIDRWTADVGITYDQMIKLLRMLSNTEGNSSYRATTKRLLELYDARHHHQLKEKN